MPNNVPERTLGFVLHDVARALRKRLEQRARETQLGLTRAQWSVLAHLARQEGINQAALAQILEIEPITLPATRLSSCMKLRGLMSWPRGRRICSPSRKPRSASSFSWLGASWIRYMQGWPAASNVSAAHTFARIMNSSISRWLSSRGRGTIAVTAPA